MSSQANGRAGQPGGDRSSPPTVPIAIAVVIIVALAAGFAVAGVLAISRRHWEIVVTSSRGVGAGQAMAFVEAEAVRIGIGFLAIAVMLSGWAAALASLIARRGSRWATPALAASVTGLVITVPCLFPPWRIGRSMFVTGAYSALVLLVLMLEANQRRRLNRIVVYLAALSSVAVIAGGIVSRSSGVPLAEGVGLGLLLAAIGFGHRLALGQRRTELYNPPS